MDGSAQARGLRSFRQNCRENPKPAVSDLPIPTNVGVVIPTTVRIMVPKISAAEWEVMNVVWAQHPVTAAQVYAGLPATTEWKQKTVNTFLARLVEKKVLSVTKQGNVNLYAPRLR